ncbi:pectinesterase-like [Salvia splendens]|uniref:pectinesterase-like n=1 Tax=Salvia splendens TaxID=180675 RepID=UPI001C27D6F2|nr:pectinesterase-like [Salvia splendens]
MIISLSLSTSPILGSGLGLAPSPSPSPTLNQNLTNSLHVVVASALNEANDTLVHINLAKPSDSRERAALSDCSEFYCLSVEHLSQSLHPGLGSTPFDVQIWLSTALTNLDSCRTSMAEQSVAHPFFMRNHASELITKALAINAEMVGPGSQKHLHSCLPDVDDVPEQPRGGGAVVVAQDGSGTFRTIKEAVDGYWWRETTGRYVIHVKQGTYHEYVEIRREMKDVVMVGDGIGKTIITGDKSAKSGFSTRESATFKVMGDGFVARDMTFRNTAGPTAGQAVAVLSASDRSAFYRCSIEGYQDTLWAAANRQLFEECQIYGTIDFIFGNAAAVFQKSEIYARAPLHGHKVVITAQGREQDNQPTGFSIVNCRFEADPSQKQEVWKFKAYLGRPWKDYARVVFIRSYLDGMLDPAGWMDWDDKGDTVYYGEYGNYGPGSGTNMRVTWPGVRIIQDVQEAENFTVTNFIGGQQWLPQSGVPFSSGLC